MISQKRLLLAVLMIIIAVSLAGWGVWLWNIKTQPNGNANNINMANANISNVNITNANIANVNDANINNQLNVNTSIDTSNWQTYRNEEMGYTILRPNDWQVKSQDGAATISCDLEWPKCAWSLTITTTNDELSDLIEEYNKSDLLPSGDTLSKIYKQEDFIFNKYPATRLTGTTALGIDNIFVIVNSANKRYVLSYNDVKGESRDIGEKIIQTFSIIP